MPTPNITSPVAAATSRLEEEIDATIVAFGDVGIGLKAGDAAELLTDIDDYDAAAQWLRELARLLDMLAIANKHIPTPAPWSELSHFAKIKELARRSDNDVRTLLEEVAEELRIESMADAEMDAYREGNISRQTLVARLEELAGRDVGILEYFKTTPRFGMAWHDDSVEAL